MRYHRFLIGLIAIFLGVATLRTDRKSLLSHTERRISTDVIHAMRIRDEEDRFMEDVKNCDQFLSLVTALAADIDNATSQLGLVEACERVVIVLYTALEETAHGHLPTHYMRNLQIPLNLEQLYSRTMPPPQMTAGITATENECGFGLCDFARSFGNPTTRYSKRINRREEVCEAKVCDADNLEEMCESTKLEPSSALTCKMCYPERNSQLITAHCQAKWRKERRAFYIVSFVLIAVTLTSGLILYLRRRYLRAKNIQREQFQNSNPEINPPGEIYYYDGARSIMPSERDSPPLDLNYFPNSPQRGDPKKYHSSWENSDEEAIGTSTAQRRLKQLGIVSRTGRKRIHDLFDLEALRSKNDKKSVRQHSNDADRVPVMPWAPNASIRMNERASYQMRQEKKWRGSSAVELKEVSKSDPN